MANEPEQRVIEIILKAQDANASIKEMGAGAAVMNAQLNKMGQDDPGRAQLLADLQQLSVRIKAANDEKRTYIKSEEELREETERLHAANQQTIEDGTKTTASFTQMKAAAGLLEKQLSEISADDPGRAQLQRDFTLLEQRIKATRAEMTTYVKTAGELEEEQRQLAAETERLNQENIQVVVNGKRVTATYNEMDAAAKQLEKELKALTPGTAEFIEKSKDLVQVKGRIEAVSQQMGEATKQTNYFKQALAIAGVSFGLDAIVSGVMDAGRAIFEATAKFETFSAVLTNTLGSESEAQLAMHDLQVMAAETPFGVEELTSSYIKFVNRGLKPSMQEMTKMADLAASQGKSFDQLTEAVLDAATGEFERLKEFGIQAHKNGDEVSLAFKGTQQVVANTPEAINAALLAFGELDGVMGGTAIISQTLEGQVSNLGDTTDQLKVQLGTGLRPVFIAIISTIGTLLGLLAAAPAFIAENRGALLALAGAVLTFNAPMIQTNALLLYNAALSKGKVVWDGAVTISTKAWEIAQRGLNLALSANPIGAVIAVGTLLAGVFVSLYDKSEKVRATVAGMGAAFMSLVDTLKTSVMQQLTGVGELLVGIFTGSPEKIKAGLVSLGQSVKTFYYDSGIKAAEAYSKGYDEKLAAERAAKAGKAEDAAAAAAAAKKTAEAAAKAKAEADAKAHLEALKTEEANLKVRLTQAEDGSRQEMKLKQQLIAVHAKIELEDAKKTENDKRVIRAESLDKMQDLERAFNTKQAKEREDERKRLQKLAEDAAKKELALQRSIEDMQVAAIKDKHEREIAEINLQTNRKMAALEGDNEKVMAQWELMEQARQDRIAAVREKQREEEEKRKADDLQKRIKQQQAEEEEQAAQLALDFEKGLLAEQGYQEALYNLKRNALDSQLALAREKGGEESAQYKRLAADRLKIDSERAKKQKEIELDIRKFNQHMQSDYAAMLVDSVGVLVDNLNQKSSAYASFKIILQAMQLAEVGMNLQNELSNNALVASDPKNPLRLTLGPLAEPIIASQLALKNGIAIGRAALTTVKIAAFEKGGNTMRPADVFSVDQVAGLLSGTSGGSFASGGPVKKPTLGLIGEAGAELVIPNWMYADPKQADLMGFLEAQIASRGNTFASGGSTVKDFAVATPAAGDNMGSVLSDMVRVLGSLDGRLANVEDWQSKLEVVNDLQKVREGLETINQVRTGGGIQKKP